jgi:hypothetical protein
MRPVDDWLSGNWYTESRFVSCINHIVWNHDCFSEKQGKVGIGWNENSRGLCQVIIIFYSKFRGYHKIFRLVDRQMETFSGFPSLKYKYLAIIVLLAIENKFLALQFHNVKRKIRANKFQENKLHAPKTSMQYSVDCLFIVYCYPIKLFCNIM